MINYRNLNKFLFDQLTTSIYSTAPIKCDPTSNLTVLSQTFHRDVAMYLIAAKSFAAYVPLRNFIVVDDGLNDADRTRIRQHLSNVSFIPSAEVDTGSCPRGACWERLLAISQASETSFVVQLDADTITTSRPDEVIRCIQEERCFTLSTKQGREFVSLKDASDFALNVESEHVQIQAERALANIPNCESRRYIRGCAGFAGFAPGSLQKHEIESFSLFMEEAIGGAAWRRWGSEQATSNYMIANTENPLALPLEQYPYWAPGTELTDAKLIHFIGEHRFTSFKYLQLARKTISKLDR